MITEFDFVIISANTIWQVTLNRKQMSVTNIMHQLLIRFLKPDLCSNEQISFAAKYIEIACKSIVISCNMFKAQSTMSQYFWLWIYVRTKLTRILRATFGGIEAKHTILFSTCENLGYTKQFFWPKWSFNSKSVSTQFHQHFTSSFCADSLSPKNYKAKL